MAWRWWCRARGFDAGAVPRAVREEKCTALYGVPTMFIAALNHPDFETYDPSSLRTGIMAGSTCPVELMQQVIGRMDMSEITIVYGMTETSPVGFQSAMDGFASLAMTGEAVRVLGMLGNVVRLSER